MTTVGDTTTHGAIPLPDITGLVLAGGRGSRMGGRDKGLQPHRGQPLAAHALQRLAPQVGTLMLSANRHLDTYAGFGVPVWPDALPDHPGPLAGLLAGLRQCRTPWLASVPCDTPDFPVDLVARLARAAQAEQAELAMAAVEVDGELRRQPVFCLLRRELAERLAHSLQAGQRGVDRWARQQRHVLVRFDEAAAFRNVNTLQELRDLQ